MVNLTMSFAKGKKSETSISHNNRSIDKDFDFEKKGHQHIQAKFTHMNEVLIHENIRDVYEHEFGDAVRDYNQKQKRKDRKIENYYDKVKNSKNMRTQYEFVVQIGNKEFWDRYSHDSSQWQLGKKILEKYYDGFSKRNPRLHVYNAAIHMDEQGSPHLHLNVVPKADGYSRGVKVRPSFDKALKQQGIAFDSKDSRSLFKNFQALEQEALADVARPYKVERKRGITNKLRDVHEYKEAQQMIAQARDHRLSEINQQVSEKQLELSKVTKSVDDEKRKRDWLRYENKRLEEQQRFQKQQAQQQEALRKAVLAKQDQEIAEKKKLLEKLEEKLKATKDRATELAKHVATSLKELSSNAAQAFMRKFGELETSSQLERGVDKYDVEFPELEKAGFTDEQEEAFEDGANIAEEKHDQQNSKSVGEPVETEQDKPKKSLEEQYKQYLASQGMNR